MDKKNDNNSNNLNAIIYCRTATTTQSKQRNTITSKELHCRQYAKDKGYIVVQTFLDEGYFGTTLERPSLQEMLAFLEKQKGKEHYTIIIDDISSLARDMVLYLKLRETLRELGAKLESPSINFSDNPDSILIENIMVAKFLRGSELVESSV